MKRGRVLGLLSLWFGLLVIARATLLDGFDLEVGTALALFGGLVLALTGLYGTARPAEFGDEWPRPFAYLFAFGVVVYSIATLWQVAF